MRIKTSKSVEELLPKLKDFLGFDNNAQVLKLGISFAINEMILGLEQVVEDGFEIDINVLLGDEKAYYNKLIEFKLEDKVDKHIYSQLIEYGIHKIDYYYKICKRDKIKFTQKVLEDLCI